MWLLVFESYTSFAQIFRRIDCSWKILEATDPTNRLKMIFFLYYSSLICNLTTPRPHQYPTNYILITNRSDWKKNKPKTTAWRHRLELPVLMVKILRWTPPRRQTLTTKWISLKWKTTKIWAVWKRYGTAPYRLPKRVISILQSKVGSIVCQMLHDNVRVSSGIHFNGSLDLFLFHLERKVIEWVFWSIYQVIIRDMKISFHRGKWCK